MGISFFKSGNLQPKIETLEHPIYFVGISKKTTDKKIFKDVEKLGKQFNAIKDKNPISNVKQPWAFVAVTKDYDPKTGTMEYMIGDVVEKLDAIPDKLSGFHIPALTYAVFPIKPRFKILWGLTIGRTKHYIYTKWLPASAYDLEGSIDDFEYHDEKSLGKKPEISLYVAVKIKQR